MRRSRMNADYLGEAPTPDRPEGRGSALRGPVHCGSSDRSLHWEALVCAESPAVGLRRALCPLRGDSARSDTPSRAGTPVRPTTARAGSTRSAGTPPRSASRAPRPAQAPQSPASPGALLAPARPPRPGRTSSAKASAFTEAFARARRRRRKARLRRALCSRLHARPALARDLPPATGGPRQDPLPLRVTAPP
jgi:hypothetical protein